jgi:hypothetical protein
MSVFALRCPWCSWFGVTSGFGDDSPADFLKDDFMLHVRAEHAEYLEVAEHLEAEPVTHRVKSGC